MAAGDRERAGARRVHPLASIRHSKRAAGSAEENVTVAEGCTADGRIATARVSAGTVSTVHVRAGGAASVNPGPLPAATQPVPANRAAVPASPLIAPGAPRLAAV